MTQERLAKIFIELEPILFPLFETLRKEQFPIGIAEYKLAIESVEKQINLNDIDRLKRFLQLLWVKSQPQQTIFCEAFDNLVQPELQKRLSSPQKQRQNQPNRNSPPTKQEEKKDTDDRKQTPENGTQTPIDSQNKDENIENKTDFSPTKIKTKELIPDLSTIKPIFRTNYNFTPRLPIDKRQMINVFKGLRKLKRQGTPEELDTEATINYICRYCFFLRPILKPRRRNQVKLLLLIDREGSMCPFDLLIDTLQMSINQAGLLGGVSTYYFYNYPQSYLFANANFTGSIAVKEVLANYGRNSSVLIISDGGAAKRTYSKHRLEKTQDFITLLKNYTDRFCWLNPVPKTHWSVSSAGDIADLLPMYPLDYQGLNNTVKTLLAVF